MRKELEYLNEIKVRLLSACIDGVKITSDGKGNQINILEIRSDAWHRIFKTDEFNKLSK